LPHATPWGRRHPSAHATTATGSYSLRLENDLVIELVLPAPDTVLITQGEPTPLNTGAVYESVTVEARHFPMIVCKVSTRVSISFALSSPSFFRTRPFSMVVNRGLMTGDLRKPACCFHWEMVISPN